MGAEAFHRPSPFSRILLLPPILSISHPASLHCERDVKGRAPFFLMKHRIRRRGSLLRPSTFFQGPVPHSISPIPRPAARRCSPPLQPDAAAHISSRRPLNPHEVRDSRAQGFYPIYLPSGILRQVPFFVSRHAPHSMRPVNRGGGLLNTREARVSWAEEFSFFTLPSPRIHTRLPVFLISPPSAPRCNPYVMGQVP